MVFNTVLILSASFFTSLSKVDSCLFPLALYVAHWLSSGGNFTHRGHMAMSGDVFVTTEQGWGWEWEWVQLLLASGE